MNLHNKKALITGGSAGIGKAFVKELVKGGVTRLAVVGRGQEALDELQAELPGIEIILIQADVSSTFDIGRIVQSIEESWGELDILINNAGVVSASLLDELSDEDIVNQITINVTGLILLTKKCLPLLKKSEEGAIINVSSGLGYLGMPFYTVYCATKAAVRQFSDALRRELYAHPLHVMTIYPTATDTPMMKNADMEGMDSPEEVAQRSLEGLLNKEINVIFGGEKRLQAIRLNFEDPKKMDEQAIARFDELKKRTENHRSM